MQWSGYSINFTSRSNALSSPNGYYLSYKLDIAGKIILGPSIILLSSKSLYLEINICLFINDAKFLQNYPKVMRISSMVISHYYWLTKSPDNSSLTLEFIVIKYAYRLSHALTSMSSWIKIFVNN